MWQECSLFFKLILLKSNQILNEVDDRVNCAAMSWFIFQSLSVLSVFGLVNTIIL